MNKFESLKERIKKNFKENKVLLFVFVAIWIATIIITLTFYNNTLGKQSVGNEGSQYVVELTKTSIIRQEIAVNEIEDTESICIKFATYARNNSGNVFVNVVGSDSKKEYLNKSKSDPKYDRRYIFSDYCILWLKDHSEVISQRVYDDYESIINKRIKNTIIGNAQIKSLTYNMFNIYFNNMAEKYSKATIDKTWVVIKQVLTYGMEEEEIPLFPLTRIKRPNETKVAVKKKEIPFITEDDINKVYNEVYTSKRYKDGALVIVFIMYSGLRISEAIGLKWNCVSKDFSEIKIEKVASKIVERNANMEPIIVDGKMKYKKIQKGTKSVDSQRTVPIIEKNRKILEYFNNMPHNENDYVFRSSTGNRFDARALERTLKSILINSNCSRTDYTPHCLRHGFGSLLIKNGVDIKIVSELLGHSDVAFTYNTYIGIEKEDKSSALNKVFGQKKGNT